VAVIIHGGGGGGGGFDPDGAVTINESGAEVDFRVEAGDSESNALFVLGDETAFTADPGMTGYAGWVGIGTDEPRQQLHIHEDDNVAGRLCGFRFTAAGDSDPTAAYGMSGFALLKHTENSGGANRARHALMVNLEDAPFSLGSHGIGSFVGGTTQGMVMIDTNGRFGVGYMAGGHSFVPGGNGTTNKPLGRLDIGDGALFMSSISEPTVPANREIGSSSTAKTTGALYIEDNSGEPVLKFKSNSATYTVTLVAD
jgi:hypothetical protein